jgi:hypothetical protein
MTTDGPAAGGVRVHGIPNGLRVSLHRARIRPGREDEATEWMQMLNDRHAEAVQTLERERMAMEVVFRSSEADGDYLTWVTLHGPGEAVDTSTHPLDADHLAYDRRVRQPEWMTAEPQLLLLPGPVRTAVERWARVPSADRHGTSRS